MTSAFHQLLAAAREPANFAWLQVDENAPTDGGNAVPALKLLFTQLGLRRPAVLYKCRRTGQIWPRSVAGLFPGASSPCLDQVAQETLNDDPRIGRRRVELVNWDGFRLGLWAEEHSAQLAPKENARLQNLFREGSRNILSSTTTLELGIDIGGLSAVLLGNLPPGKANYLQRAGRAGRRADGTSAVLGFARPTSYEREVFLNFGRYLNQDLRRPTVFLDRAPLVRRHFNAWLLGEFFRTRNQGGVAGAMDSYGKMGPFMGELMPPRWAPGLPMPPWPPVQAPDPDPSIAEQFIQYLQGLDGENVRVDLQRLWDGCENVDAAQWDENISGVIQQYTSGISEWRSIVRELLQSWHEIPRDNPGQPNFGFHRAQANAIRFQLLALHQMTVIEALADSRVLPRYGFPIGLSRLRVQVGNGNQPANNEDQAANNEDQYRLQRDRMLALREYAPGSQLLVGGKVITSRGLLKHWTGAVIGDEAWGLRGNFVKDRNGYFDYSLTAAPPQPPQGLNGAVGLQRGHFLLPKHGFTTAAWDPPRYGSDFDRVGKLSVFTLAFGEPAQCDPPQLDFGDSQGCSATYRDAGELFLMNSGEHERGFAICQKCGYAESEWSVNGAAGINLPKGFEFHPPLNSKSRARRCWAPDEAPVWRHHHLAARQTTNLLRLEFPIPQQIQPMGQSILYTIGQALRLVGAALLQVDEREIGILDPIPDVDTGAYQSVILYDTLAGGSGHLAELCHPEKPDIHRRWMQGAIKLLTVDGELPAAVKERESIRRLLTASCNDALLAPGEALQLLLRLNGEPGAGPIDAPLQANPPDGLGLDDLHEMVLANQQVPDAFQLNLRPNQITGMNGGWNRFVRWGQAGPPVQNQVVVALLPNVGVAVGRWFYSPRQDPGRPHRVRLRDNLFNIAPLDLTEQDFQAIRVLARSAE